MLEVDFHVHSHFSKCGVHSVLELLTRAKDLGLKGLAITDHGPALESTTPFTFFDRLFDPLPGIRLLKGMECNIVDEQGAIDLLPKHLKYIDVILLGIHPNTPGGRDELYYTDLLIRTMRRNPYIDIITHANEPAFPVDFVRVAQEAQALGMAMELNNSRVSLSRSQPEVTDRMLRAIKDVECRIVLCSDTHTINELGRDEAVRPLLKRFGISDEAVVNSTAERAFAFVEERRAVKRGALKT